MHRREVIGLLCERLRVLPVVGDPDVSGCINGDVCQRLHSPGNIIRHRIDARAPSAAMQWRAESPAV
jgi:hypothetical protein